MLTGIWALPKLFKHNTNRQGSELSWHSKCKLNLNKASLYLLHLPTVSKKKLIFIFWIAQSLYTWLGWFCFVADMISYWIKHTLISTSCFYTRGKSWDSRVCVRFTFAYTLIYNTPHPLTATLGSTLSEGTAHSIVYHNLSQQSSCTKTAESSLRWRYTVGQYCR